jgi:nitrate reductase NapE component
MFAGTTIAPTAPVETVNAASSWLSRIKLQEVLRWFLIATAIVGIFLFLLWLLRKLFGGPK